MGYERLYRSLPQWAQNVAISAQGYRLKRRRYGRVYRRYKRSLPTIYSLSRHDVTALQLSRLKEFLSYAKERSAFYSRLYEGIDIDSIESVSDLARLPAVDKETLRQHMEEVYTMPGRGTYISRTGGTTGKSLVVRTWKNDLQVRMAELDYFRETHGARHGMRRASFSGNRHFAPSRLRTR